MRKAIQPLSYGFPLLLLLLILAVLASPSLNREREGYNLLTGRIDCSAFCLHETAHKMDRESGWLSRSPEFMEAVQVYIQSAWAIPELRDPWTERIVFFPGIGAPLRPERDLLSYWFWRGGWGGYTELYAELLQWSGGEREAMPEIFRPFYDWEKINLYREAL
jgi:hypothetical protein